MRKVLQCAVSMLVLAAAVSTVQPGPLAASQGQTPTFEFLDVPGSNQTRANGISQTGEIIGLYLIGTVQHGFIYYRGEFTALDVPEALHTSAQKMSPTGDAIGFYQKVAGVMRGFHFDANRRTFHFLDYPGSTQTTPWGINPQGDVVGGYVLAGANRAFLLHKDDYSNIDFPGSFASTALDINAQGDLVGRYVPAQGAQSRMFLRTRDGVYHSIEVPGSVFTGNPGFPGGINDKGEIVGMYQDAGDMKVRGFLLDAAGYHVIDVPNTFFTAAADIDNYGNIVGRHRIQGSSGDKGFLLRR